MEQRGPPPRVHICHPWGCAPLSAIATRAVPRAAGDLRAILRRRGVDKLGARDSDRSSSSISLATESGARRLEPQLCVLDRDFGRVVTRQAGAAERRLRTLGRLDEAVVREIRE